MKISIIIPTLSRKSTLLCCLKFVFGQTRPPDEVIVVDNGSSDGTADAVKREFGSRARVIAEKAKRVDAARNRGIAEASGDLLVFTDDDIMPQPSWLASLEPCFTDPRTGAAGGPVFPIWEKAPSVFLRDSNRARSLLGNLYYGHRILEVDPEKHFLVGGNFACRKKLITGGAGFKGLWHFAHLGVCGDDYELSRRLARAHRVIYEPAAWVFHKIPAWKMSFAHILKRAFYFEAANTRLGSRLKPRRTPLQLLGREGLVSAAAAAGHIWGRLFSDMGGEV